MSRAALPETSLAPEEGAPTVPPIFGLVAYEEACKAFFGNLYDFKAELRAKNAQLLALLIVLIAMSTGFAVYVKAHHQVEVYWVDTQTEDRAPYRVLAYDPAVTGPQSLLIYFFSRIPVLLFSYTKDTLAAHREEVGAFLSKRLLSALSAQTEALIAEYGAAGHFPKGNPRVTVQSVLFPPESGQGGIRTVQVFLALETANELGRPLGPPTYHLATFQFSLRPPQSREDVIANPLGIRILAWDIVQQPNPPQLPQE